jgi:hypothetical protein
VNGVVAAKAIPVMLMTAADVERWLTGTARRTARTAEAAARRRTRGVTAGNGGGFSSLETAYFGIFGRYGCAEGL